MYIICFTLLRDGELTTDIYNCSNFCLAMSTVEQVIETYALIPADFGDCWAITANYKGITVLTLNSTMF
nr:MAG TPA: hypothetical protein [Caudoviricetes sp.]